MATTITGKLNKSANQFAAGESTGFGVRLGVQYYNRKTKQKEWTNYSAAIFARNENQIKYYQEALVEGAIVELTGQNERIDSYEGNNGVSLSIELLDASLGYVSSHSQNDPAQHASGNRNQPNPTYEPDASAPGGSMEEDIPFAPLGREYI